MDNLKSILKNYYLLGKYLSKMKPATISRFGSRDSLIAFLKGVTKFGNIERAAADAPVALPDLAHIIHDDKYLAKVINLSLQLGVNAAEAILYDRAMHGYEETTYDEDGKCKSRKRKYCAKSLLEYLKANSDKYKSRGSTGNNLKTTSSDSSKNHYEQTGTGRIGFELESYEG